MTSRRGEASRAGVDGAVVAPRSDIPTDAPPTGPWQHEVWRRNFQNRTMSVNPKGNGTQTVTVKPGYKHFTEIQDPSTNNGAPVTAPTLQDRDGVVLVKSPWRGALV